MAVIINELEVVLEQPLPLGPAVTAASPAVTTQVLNPLDLADVLERRARYRARLSAD